MARGRFQRENNLWNQKAGVAELADALDSKSSGRKVVWVRAPPPAIYLLDVRCSMRHSEINLVRTNPNQRLRYTHRTRHFMLVRTWENHNVHS
jgi:hypothetical protein